MGTGRSIPLRFNLDPLGTTLRLVWLQMPNCSRFSEVVTGGSRLRERLSLWESAEQAQEQPVILIPTETSTSFFPITALLSGLLFLPGHGDGTFGAPVDLNAPGWE